MKRNLLGISLITMGCLYGILAGVIILVFILFDLPVLYGIGISIIILILQFLISPFLTDLSMKWFYRAKFDTEIPEYLKEFIEEVCKKYNMKYPRIGFIDDGAPNAFTYGHTKNDARVILTRGIFELLKEEEVKAVVAHELGHAKHYDMLFMTVAQLVPLILYGVYQLLIDSDSDNKGSIWLAIVAYVLYIISQYIVLWLSRTREYYADYFAVCETKNPNALAEALVKIGFGLCTAKEKDEVEENEDKKNKKKKERKLSVSSVNALGIFDSKSSKSLVVTSYTDNGVSKDNIKNAMKWELWNIWAKFYELSSTHPLISKRLKAISSMSKDFNQEEYINFDLVKEESYVDDFILELIIKYLPVISLIITAVFFIITEKKLVIGIGGLVTVGLSLFKYMYIHPKNNYPKRDVSGLLGEVKVSGITSIPCELEGIVIGRGNPGYIFNEDFVIKDKTGIIFLDYNQPLFIVNKIFALFKSSSYFDKIIQVRGWYRRSPVPYVEIYEMIIDGKVKKVYTYLVSIILHIILFAIFTYILVISL